MSRQARRFSHWAHLCNFAPLWVRRCLFRLPARPKDLWHWAHLCNFAPEWDNKCLLRSLAYVNDLRHIVQVLLLAILILVKVSNLSSAVVDYYWRPFDPDRLSSSSLDMVIIMVWQNHSLPFFRQPHCSRSLLKWHNFFANLPYSNGPTLGQNIDCQQIQVVRGTYCGTKFHNYHMMYWESTTLSGQFSG